MKTFNLTIYFVFLFPFVVGANPELHELRESPRKINKDFERASSLTEEAISKLQLESEELENAYIQVFLTDSLAGDQMPNRIPRDGGALVNWRETVKRDMLRRGASVQPVIEKIFQDNDGVSTSLLRKIGFLPQIDKEPFVRWVREYLDETGTDNIQSTKLSQLADFIARNGSLGDLEYLERVAKDVPLDDPERWRLIERRKSELLGRSNESELEVVESGKGENSGSQGQPEALRERDPVDQDDDGMTRGSVSESTTLPKWALGMIVVAVLGILILLIRAFLGSRA